MKPHRHSLTPSVLASLGFALIGILASVVAKEPAASREESVKPGINENFLNPDLDVDEWVKRFEIESREVFSARIEILKALALAPGEAVADVGAGTGLFTAAMSKAVGDGGKVYAVDISEAFVKHLKARAADEKLANVEAVLCDEDSVKLPAASVDVVFVCDTYHHFEFPKSTLASIHEALKPGGRLIVVDFERIPGESSEWILNHVRAGKEEFTAEIEAAGLKLEEALKIPGLKENYALRFRKPKEG